MRYVLVLTLLLAACAAPREEYFPPSYEQVQDPALFQMARGVISRKLRDPESARFTDEYAARFEHGIFVCGRVNARNGFGGYAGSELFAVMLDPEGRPLTSNIGDEELRDCLKVGFPG